MHHRYCAALILLLMLATAGYADNDPVIAGRVVDAAGKPVAGIKVYADYGREAPAVTGADGGYRLTGLPVGQRVIRAEDPTGQTVAMPLVNRTIIAGRATPVADLVMMAGGLLEGVVTDAGMGQGLAGAVIGIYSPDGVDMVRPAPRTDALGHFTVRVPPGQFSIGLLNQLPGFVTRQVLKEVVVAKDTTQTVLLQLSHGRGVSGVVVDTNNQPITGLDLQLTVRSGNTTSGFSAKVGDGGTWSSDSLPAGELSIGVSVLSNLELVSAKTFTLPTTQPVKVVVRKVATLPLRGRVVTVAGAPVTRMAINMTLAVKTSDTATTSSSLSYTTDAAGRLDAAEVRSDAKITLAQFSSGYRYRSGGTVTQQDGAFVMSDLVLAPLTARLEGTVLDRTGAPVAGAIVASPDSDIGDSAVTDAQGHFALAALPEGQPDITVLATYQGLYAEVHAKAVDQVRLRLAPLPARPQLNVQRGYELLQRLWEAGPQGVTERDEKLYQALQELWPGTATGRYRNTIPAALAASHPDLALKLISGSDAVTHDSMLAQIITVLAAADPATAATWAPSKVALFEDHSRGITPTLTLALAIADIAPDTARSLYQQVRDYVREHRNDDNIASTLRPAWLARLALLAVRLDPAAVRALSNEALQQVKAYPDTLTSVLPTLIAVYPDEMETLLNELPPGRRLSVLAAAAPLVAVHDLTAAQHLLDLLQHEDAPASSSTYRRALLATINAIGHTHPEWAITLATRAGQDQNRGDVLMAAARFQPRDQALTLLRQIPSVATQQPPGAGGMFMYAMSYGNEDPAAQVAALAYEVDPAWGRELFAAAKEKLWQQLTNQPNSTRYPFSRLTRGLGSGLASFAYYYSRIDPAESRLLLEGAFADASHRAHAPGNLRQDIPIFPSQYGELAAIATAMAAIDTDRALTMAASLAIDGPGPAVRYGPSPQLSAYSKIGEYLVTPEPARHLQPFMQWSGIAGPTILF